MRNNKAQQEIVGFVLIVVLVVIGLMVYLAISVRNVDENEGSVEVENALNSLMKHTTDCAISYIPDYDTFQDLFKSAYKGQECSNLNKDAMDYLEEASLDVLSDMMASEASINYYELQFFVKDGEGLLKIEEGECSGSINSAQRIIASGSDKLVVRLKTCSI